MRKHNTYLIEFTDGGPLDGEEQVFSSLPENNEETTFNRYSYTFDAEEWKFRYKGRWRNLTIGNSLLTYRTFGEALRQLGQLQAVGAISAAESLEYQAKVKEELFSHVNKL